MLKIKEIENKKAWEDFLNKIEFYPLFQSWNWGEVQKKLGFKIERIGIFDSDKLIGICLLVDVAARRGRFFHLRHGPVFLEYTQDNVNFLLDYLSSKGKQKGIRFIRVSPFIEKNPAKSLIFSQKKLINAPIHNQDAEVCWVLDITKSEEELLKSMRKTHRYLIRKAQAMDIKITQTTTVSDIDRFIKFYNSFSHRKHFTPHKGIREEFEIFSQDNQAVLISAEFAGEIISSSVILYTPKMAIYHHSTSSEKYSNIPASYLIQWHAILEAKKREIPLYNFWGIAPEEKTNHPWQGLTLFKTGFGGYKKEFVHAKDLPLSFLYWKTYTIEYLRKIKKGY
ncbi:MAG: hypothetical protein A3F31_04570 [Candidatus Levybacteria bacterium RIFCSPHIGHO2_12_FULL_38_12]|nr:MAG: hypothetical protein A2770_04255 [Candidatus Levybacteria bacterium RIFCSPHIGHO2_01_FULL_38_12]OGH21816.1 MAG: hypothetical protein A3D75_01335 [Candidatus Levybacteria bacterium RIFCSPHIGHO2_02_FULL_37_18]OGH22527.1 MAG: hypothetical protein A3F31_04570 [Candidatus Levybacteria bacterium RIFCSPHIGHO2_12_FULL_38_12]OGH33437.1 MAG: hypothetical protein A3A47_04285 [Candidatus Levybacteria bacterium RIFCSPLOWO2_01_FULL_37_20]OGH44064.1 MAG: hypothetical protein A3J14_04940 [Candidatus Lev